MDELNESCEQTGKSRTSFKSKLSSAILKTKSTVLNALSNTWQGAAISAIVALLLYSIILGSIMKTGLGRAADIVLSILAVCLIFLMTYGLVTLLLVIIKRLPSRFIASIAASLIIIINIPASSFGIPFILLFMISGSIIGYAILRGIKKPLSVVLFVLIIAADIFVFSELIGSGYSTELAVPASFYHAEIKHSISDPSLAGPFKVNKMTYGSGWDKQRPEYGKYVAIKTPAVDASPFLPETSGVANKIREWYWGFNAKNFPLNARVWYPEGNGRFPLVLIVHGNHQMEEYSDPGYEYLGKLAASRGFVFASVDENFLNGNWIKDYGQSENFTRGWLLLNHLKQWKKWDSTKGNLFYNKVDMNNIVLIGHSRGGQAVAIAAAINKLKHYQNDGKINFDFNFNIRGIVQIAPNDVYQPVRDKPLELHNINYLLIQGGYDGDMYFFMGNRQYNRLSFSGDNRYFKSAIYIYRANHGQFNTVWGRHDYGPPGGWLLNLKPIMKDSDQRRIAKIYIAGFLEAVLHGKKEYIPLFRDYRKIINLLPRDFYISQFEDSDFKTIADYEEDFDLTSTALPGCTIAGKNLKTWSENSLVFRDKWNTPQHNNVVYLGWDTKDSAFSGKIPEYSVSLNDSVAKSFKINSNSRLVFFCCSNQNDSGDSLNFSVELTDINNLKVRLPVNHFGKFIPPLKLQTRKWSFINDLGGENYYERVLQLFELPLSDFAGQNKNFIPGELRKINFIFDKSKKGEIVLDKLGIVPGTKDT